MDAPGDTEPRDPQLDAYDKQRAVALEQGDFASWTALVGTAERLVRPRERLPSPSPTPGPIDRFVGWVQPPGCCSSGIRCKVMIGKWSYCSLRTIPSNRRWLHAE